MPRVAQAHLDARRRQILDAARRCFVRDGFHATSMQDILGEAGLSAGAVYRYFRGKEDIVLAIATDAIGEITRALDEALDTEVPPPLDQVVQQMLATLVRLDDTQQVGSIAVQVWAEALRSPHLAAQVAEAIGRTRGQLARLAELYQRHGQLGAGVPPEHVARTLVALLPGFLLQRTVLGDVEPAMFAGSLRALLGTA
jgi:TetR/AcrR family transcriptional regulator, transcriptional repressor of aconitase